LALPLPLPLPLPLLGLCWFHDEPCLAELCWFHDELFFFHPGVGPLFSAMQLLPTDGAVAGVLLSCSAASSHMYVCAH
jgi:hypothetical protein